MSEKSQDFVNSEDTIVSAPVNTDSHKPSHNMTGNYAVLMETSGEHYESWYYFIRKEGNEDALEHLQNQLRQINWYILDDLSTFDLDLEHFVSAQTAKEMTNLDLNSESFHRKFDGKLEKISFDFSKKDLKHNDRKIIKVYEMLGCGQIENYITDEDIDSDFIVDSDCETDVDSVSSSSPEKKVPAKSLGKLPPSLMKNVPKKDGNPKKTKK